MMIKVSALCSGAEWPPAPLQGFCLGPGVHGYPVVRTRLVALHHFVILRWWWKRQNPGGIAL